MELHLKLRLATSEGMSQRQAAKHFNISRDSFSKMLSYSTLPGYQRRSPPRRPKLDAFVLTIDRWLDEDGQVPSKQRHTARRVYRRLYDYQGSHARTGAAPPGSVGFLCLIRLAIRRRTSARRWW